MKTRLMFLLVVVSLQSSALFAQVVNVNLSVDATTPGHRINEDFVGFSMEKKTMTTDVGGGSTVGSFWVASPTALTRLRNLLTNISPSSIIRVGGDATDRLAWIPSARGTNTSTTNLYNSDIDKFFGFLSTVGWKSIYAVNLAKDSANYAGNAIAENAAEANYVYSTYGSMLKSISIGNEPMAFVVMKYRNPYNPSLYIANYLPHYDAIKSVNPAIPISGGDIGRRTEYNTWNMAYLEKMNNLPSTSPARPINSFNVHAYPFRENELIGGMAEQNIDAVINSLSPGSTFQSNLSYVTNLANSYNTPFRMSENNYITEGAGTAAGMNSFATAIWTLDYLYTLANYKVEGANFHSGGGNPTYTPLYRTSTANDTYGFRAMYYGLLAFMDGARNRRLLPVTPQMTASAPRASYYATKSEDGKTLTVTLINKDFPNTINADVNIPGVSISAVSYQALRPQTNMYDGVANSFYANAQVAPDGSFSKSTPTPISPTSSTNFSVTLAPMTAVVATVTLQSPDLTLITYVRPSIANGLTPISVVADVVELNSVPTSGPITVKLSKDAVVNLSFDPGATLVNGRSVQNSAWRLSGPSGGFYTLTSNQVIGGGGVLSFGLSGSLSPGATTGALSISTVLVGGSGGDSNTANNADADKIDYFQQ